MKVYHGSLEIVQNPEIRKPNHTLDYGAGFYTTTSYEQAENWVKKRMLNNKINDGYINVYELDEDVLKSLNRKIFEEASDEWLDFVMTNRTGKSYNHNYDVVYGLVANDKVYTAFGLFESGIYRREELIKELKTYTLVDQYLFHTELSLRAITFLEVRKICLAK